MLAARRMECPTCLRPTTYNGNPHRPFCSERCKLIDLGRWASGGFRIPTNERPTEDPGLAAGEPEE